MTKNDPGGRAFDVLFKLSLAVLPFLAAMTGWALTRLHELEIRVTGLEAMKRGLISVETKLDRDSERLTVVETNQRVIVGDVKEIKGDVKKLLRETR